MSVSEKRAHLHERETGCSFAKFLKPPESDRVLSICSPPRAQLRVSVDAIRREGRGRGFGPRTYRLVHPRYRALDGVVQEQRRSRDDALDRGPLLGGETQRPVDRSAMGCGGGKEEKARRRSERGGWTIARRWDRWRERERAEPRARRRSRRVHLEPRDAARVSRWRVRRARASRRVAMAVRLSSALVASGVRCRRLRVARDAPGRENHPEQRVVVVHARGHRRSASRAPFDGVEELDSLRASRHPDRSVASRSNRRRSKLPLRTSGELPHLRAALVPRDPARTDLVYLPGRTRRRRLCGRAPLASALEDADVRGFSDVTSACRYRELTRSWKSDRKTSLKSGRSVNLTDTVNAPSMNSVGRPIKTYLR